MAELMLVNPRRRRKTKAKARRKTPVRRKRNPSTVAKRRASPVRRRRPAARVARRKTRRYRRNPTARGVINSAVIPALTAATGAVGFNALWSFLPVPAMLNTGPLRHVTKAAGALAAGMVADQVIGRKRSSELVAGALTVIAYDAVRETLATLMPNSAALGYYSAGMPVGYESGDGMGAYVPGGGLGAYVGGEGLPYQASGTLTQPFAPNEPQNNRLENEQNMGAYY